MMILDASLRGDVAVLQAIADPQARLNAFTAAIVAQGGTLILPATGDSWGPGRFEFSYRGILATGETPDEALAEWLACARRVIAAEVAVTTLTGSPADLAAACTTVRLRSQDGTAIAAVRRVEDALRLGLH